MENMLQKLSVPTKVFRLYHNEILPTSITSNSQRFPEDLYNPVHYLRVFLRFGYFFCFIPFTIKRPLDGQYYRVESSPFHRLTCIIIHTLSTIRFLMSIRIILRTYNYKDSSPVLYFEICRSILTAIYMGVFKYTFWTQQSTFCSLANDLVRITFSPTSCTYCKRRVKTATLTSFICLLYSITPIFSVLVGSEVINAHHWGLRKLLESYAGMAKYTFFFSSKTNPIPLEEFDFLIYVLLPLYAISSFYWFLAGHYFDLSVLMGTMTLRHLAGVFAHTVNSCHDSYFISTILREYAALKELSAKINSVLSGVALCFVIEAFPYYATHFDDILTLDDWYDRFRYIFYVVNFILILVVASDIIVKVDYLKSWLSCENNALTLPSTKAVILINELQNHPVGLKPGGILTINYGFIGTMVSVVVTYAVIILQFNFASSANGCPGPTSTTTTLP